MMQPVKMFYILKVRILKQNMHSITMLKKTLKRNSFSKTKLYIRITYKIVYFLFRIVRI